MEAHLVTAIVVVNICQCGEINLSLLHIASERCKCGKNWFPTEHKLGADFLYEKLGGLTAPAPFRVSKYIRAIDGTLELDPCFQGTKTEDVFESFQTAYSFAVLLEGKYGSVVLDADSKHVWRSPNCAELPQTFPPVPTISEEEARHCPTCGEELLFVGNVGFSSAELYICQNCQSKGHVDETDSYGGEPERGDAYYEAKHYQDGDYDHDGFDNERF